MTSEYKNELAIIHAKTMSSYSLPVYKVELTVLVKPSRNDLRQPVIKILCRLEPYGHLVELCWRRSSRITFPEILNRVDRRSVVFVTGRFSATIYKQSSDLVYLKSIDAEKIVDRESRNYQDGCTLAVVDDSEEQRRILEIKYYKAKVELNKVTESLEKMKISEPSKPLVPEGSRPNRIYISRPPNRS